MRLMRYLNLVLVSLLLTAGPVAAHEETEHHHPATAAAKGGAAVPGEVEVVEHLGEKIPLDLMFRDETGQTVRLGDMVTGPTIILPVYYGCSNVCNYLQSGLARILPGMKPQPGVDYRIISVSMDETEPPELAARYQKMYLTAVSRPIPKEGWRFLTGDYRAIHRLTDAAGYHFKRLGHDFIHPVACFVVTGDGMIVRYLYGSTFLPKDLTLALTEAQRGQVGATVRKMVSYCFNFDPATKSYRLNLLRVTATVVVLCCLAFLGFLILSGRSGNAKRSGDK